MRSPPLQVIGRALASAYSAVHPDVRRHAAQLPLAGLSQLLPGRPSTRPVADDGHRPVILVHGLGGAPGNFLPMRTYFHVMGRRRTYTFGWTGRQGVTQDARRLQSFIARVAQTNGLRSRDQVDIVAHSMGGLVARLALEDTATAARIQTLITLGTPHRGTLAARFADTRQVRALRPGSSLVSRLNAQLPWRARRSWPNLVAFWSGADMLLLPPRSACVRGARNVELRGQTHYGYLISPTAWSAVWRALGPPVAARGPRR